jgi:AcrR family transcriptional regulator
MGRKSIKHIRQREIVEAFYEVARKEGLENASIAKIAAALAIHPSLIIHYFSTREDLISALIEFNLERYSLLYQPSGQYPDCRARIYEIMDRLFSKSWNALFDDGVFYSCYALIFRDERIRSRYKRVHDSLRQHLAGVLEEGIRAGVLDIPDAAGAADQVFIIVEGAYYYLSLVSDEAEYQRKLREYKQLSLSILKLRPEPSFSDCG